MNPSPNHVLLQTKTVLPQLRKNLVPRRRLTELLDQGTERRLTTVCAPAGFGKTTLLSQWIDQTGSLVSWLSLEKGDNDLIRFWRYVVQSVAASASPHLVKRVSQHLPLLPAASIHTFLDAFINDLYTIAQPVVLVWDDYQYIGLPDIHASVAYFIDQLPAHIRLVIAARSELPFSTVKWTAKAEHTAIDVRQLQFTLAETEAYYSHTAALPLTRAQMDALFERTEGWVTALQLISISLQSDSDYDRLIDSFTGGHRAVADYMFQEVLSELSEEMLQFLLQTSMLGRMDAALCEVVTKNQNSHQLLEQLKARNLFLISLDEHNGWFRYHHLFAEFLQNRMKRLQPNEWLTCNRAASISFASRGYVVEAIDHAIAASDSVLTESLLEKHAPYLLMQGEFTALLRWLDSFPEDRMKRSPDTALLHAFVLIVTGQSDRAEMMIERIQQLPDHELGQEIQSGLLFVKSNLLFTSGRFEQWIAFANGGLDEMLPQSSIYYNFNYNQTEPLVRRTSFGMNGTLTAATESIAHLFTSTLRRHNWNESLINLYVMQSLCEGYYEWDRLDDAAALLPVVERAARANQTPGLYIPNQITQAMIYMAQGMAYLAHDTIDAALQAMTRERESLHWKQALIACKIRLYLREGNVPLARKELPKLHISAKERPVLSRCYEYVTLARLLGAQHKEADALRVLSLLKAQAVRENQLISVVEITILEACLTEQRGHRASALRLLHEALTITEPFHYIRSYVDEGARMQGLLQKYAMQRSLAPDSPLNSTVANEYVQRLLQHFPGRLEEAAEAAPTEELTRSELELLKLIRQGASNRSIAQTLMLAEGTVKVYVSRIYAKLGVSSRTQALLAAQKLQLLDGE
ncbi:LuxR C-terminal-related transcriptional regulator [Bacillus sp. FJAT-26390]|uniref:LuxR C-terminal-related transcriptional regulator n=1 Tax=Bacillus sp. FJAT-26390 TaxID=1743142 RepID=UPI000807A73E|nr:LuxR C-terminal-related transcriptional regulator [Bacillus sp. FJAT-26390]OBZ08776.1 hypothetical protein A7975_26990 [Bacillus sp. FJAT-26390]